MLAKNLSLLISNLIPADLQDEVERSLRVPQVGPHHQEGSFMDSHLVRVHESLMALWRGSVDTRVPQGVAQLMIMAVQTIGLEDMQRYMLLHDLDKANCLSLVMADGRKVAVTWDEWQAMFDPAVSNLEFFCRGQGIEKISYFQETEEGTRHHGAVTAERLRGREDISPIIVDAIGEHEMCFTFGARGGINIPLIERLVQDKGSLEIGFTFAVNYADQMGSLGDGGKPSIEDFLLMAESFVAYRRLMELTARLTETDRLDANKVSRAVTKLRKATDAFREEDVEAAYGRIIEECELPEVSAEQVREALAPAIKEGLPEEVADAIVNEMVAYGQISRESGKRLGRFNRTVRPALANLG